ncbi:TonB family protein [Labrenzia sp. 011]|uniref:energy transducer TonB n=1 Tax=Labrenzia sp. 011 TaxID=2171494 RepID=UPI000D51D210|nr:TonB family protein [Labrenzia sp. 011]PVB59604.1 hypothetical protein DCO57_21400 [Labrenzia sp. 011]
MKFLRRPLLIALAVSVAIHILAAAMTLKTRPELEIEGAGAGIHAVLGQSPFNTIVAGTVATTVTAEPVDVREVQTPVEPETARAKPVAETATEVAPVEPAASASLPVSPTPTVALPVAPEPQPDSPAAVRKVEDIEIAEAKSIENRPSPVQPAKPVVAEAAPVKTAMPEPPSPVKATEVRSEDVLHAETDAPAPRSKPEPPRQKIARAQPARTRTPETKKPVKTQPQAQKATRSGAGGQSNRTAQKGGSQRKGKSDTAGNSDVTNYPAKVHRKLLRAVRAPKGGRRPRKDAVIHFTIRRNGSVTSVRLARSSGSRPFDQAAMKAVSRAAPFPPIPASAGRKSWTFTLPVAMR